ncbi:hypothetical protein AcW1_009506 [Taiwanofungus camphoratus]|nr:hypothetical protein AcW1_009506 [Antrodia cinnamomea]
MAVAAMSIPLSALTEWTARNDRHVNEQVRSRDVVRQRVYVWRYASSSVVSVKANLATDTSQSRTRPAVLARCARDEDAHPRWSEVSRNHRPPFLIPTIRNDCAQAHSQDLQTLCIPGGTALFRQVIRVHSARHQRRLKLGAEDEQERGAYTRANAHA